MPITVTNKDPVKYTTCGLEYEDFLKLNADLSKDVYSAIDTYSNGQDTDAGRKDADIITYMKYA